MPQEVAGWILELDWTLPYLLAAIGTPGLTQEERDRLWEAQDVEGQYVSSNLGDALDHDVVARLCADAPTLEEAVEGLRGPDSERGRLIYAWLRQIANGPYQSASWNDVHAAMMGAIDPPADDQRAPTMAERMEANVRAVNEVITEAARAQGEQQNAD